MRQEGSNIFTLSSEKLTIWRLPHPCHTNINAAYSFSHRGHEKANTHVRYRDPVSDPLLSCILQCGGCRVVYDCPAEAGIVKLSRTVMSNRPMLERGLMLLLQITTSTVNVPSILTSAAAQVPACKRRCRDPHPQAIFILVRSAKRLLGAGLARLAGRMSTLSVVQHLQCILGHASKRRSAGVLELLRSLRHSLALCFFLHRRLLSHTFELAQAGFSVTTVTDLIGPR